MKSLIACTHIQIYVRFVLVYVCYIIWCGHGYYTGMCVDGGRTGANGDSGAHAEDDGIDGESTARCL